MVNMRHGSLLHYDYYSMHPGSGVRVFEIDRGRAGFKNETLSGQFRKTEHLTPVSHKSRLPAYLEGKVCSLSDL
jgi:hypothetical protein